jgi:hypothetical protein
VKERLAENSGTRNKEKEGDKGDKRRLTRKSGQERRKDEGKPSVHGTQSLQQ